MSGKIPIIKPTKKQIKAEPSDILTAAQLSVIQDVLNKSCTGQICISRSRLYDELRKPLNLDMEKYQFEQALTAAMRLRKIVGFEMRRGAWGGICKVGAFNNSNIKIRRTRSKYNHCSVTINKQSFNVKMSEKDIIDFVSDILSGKPANNGNGTVYINNKAYFFDNSISQEDILAQFITRLCKAEKCPNG